MSSAGEVVQLLGTVPSGLETLAVEECKSFPGCLSVKHVRRGKIELTVEERAVNTVRQLRSIDHLLVLVSKQDGLFKENESKEASQRKLEDLAWQLDFTQACRVWKSFSGYEHHIRVGEQFPGKPTTLPLPTAAQYAVPKASRSASATVSETTSAEMTSGAEQSCENDSNSTVGESSASCSNDAIRDDTTSSAAEDLNDQTYTGNGSMPTQCQPPSQGISSIAEQQCETDTDLSRAAECMSLESNDKSTDVPTNGSSDSPCSTAPLVPKFRATCNRAGMNHSFSSMDAARCFGGAVNDRHHWRVQMTEYDIDVVINIIDNYVEVALALTTESLHHRNVTHFGPTVLRSTICNGMLRMAAIKPGDIVCDPMCGVGSICLEGYQTWPSAAYFCGDNHEVAVERLAGNVQDVSSQRVEAGKGVLPIDGYRWDVCDLPLRSNSIDVFITDLPFGKRIGSKTNNKTLYPTLFKEMARVCRLSSGRAVVLTQDIRTMKRVLTDKTYWKEQYQRSINIGGLKAGVFGLKRTDTSVSR